MGFCASFDHASALGTFTAGLEAATTSACAGCRSRVVSCVALVDLLDAAAKVLYRARS